MRTRFLAWVLLAVAGCKSDAPAEADASTGGAVAVAPARAPVPAPAAEPVRATHAAPSPAASPRDAGTVPVRVDVGDDVELPERYLRLMPHPPGAKVHSVIQGRGYTVTYAAPSSPEKLLQFFRDALPIRKWRVDAILGSDGGSPVLSAARPGHQLLLLRIDRGGTAKKPLSTVQVNLVE